MQVVTRRFEAETLLEGFDPYDIDLNPKFHFSDDIHNVSSAQGMGVGPRYGMAPIPNQSHTSLVSSYGGLMGSEGAGANYPNRKRVWGIIQVSLGTFSDITDVKKHWVWVNYSEQSSVNVFDFNMSVNSSGQYAADIAQFLKLEPLVRGATVTARYRLLRPDPVEYRTVNADRVFCPTATFLHRSINQTKAWWAGPVDSSYPDTASRFGLPNFGGATLGDAAFGQPPGWTYGKWKEGSRELLFYSIGGTGLADTIYDMAARWDQNVTIDADSYEPNYSVTNSTSLETAWPNATKTARDDATGYTQGTTAVTVMYDPEVQVTAQYQALMAAPGKAIMAILQEHERNSDNLPIKWFDLTSPIPSLKTLQTAGQGAGGADYQEQSRVKRTSWELWASTTYGGVTESLATIEAAGERDGTKHVCLGPSGSGLLRGNRVYEVALAVYDYTLDYETNVGVPARVYTGQDDGMCLYLFLQGTVTGGTPNPGTNEFLQKAGRGYSSIPFPTTDTELLRRMNYCEFRVYYRELGTFEWLPGGAIEMTELYYNPDLIDFAIARGPIAGVPGGQPGGFIDNSPLPPDQWNDVVVFNQRTFWISKRQMSYSLRNNPLAYPARNSVSCPKGEFRGFRVHLFKGQAEQTGRLVIFGSEETYYAEFTGTPILQPVRVSPDVVGSYPLDGSDLDIRLRSTITAFSSRASVVAEGLLYFWGPQGIFVDDGVDLPQRISANLEPDLFEWYDPNDTENIHAQYNQTTKEVVFFFRPSTAKGSEPTHALVFNRYGKWHYWKFECHVDWTQQVTVDAQDTDRSTSNQRLIAGVRASGATISRAVYFDHLCNSGDFCPTDEIMIDSIQPAGLPSYRFSLASGYSTAAFAALQVGDLVSAPSMVAYTEDSDAIDGLWEVTAKGVDYFDANDPTGASSWIGAVLDRDKYFPVYFPRTHGIDWVLESNQWCPGGLKNFWKWYMFHVSFLADLLTAAASQTITAEYRTNVSDQYGSRTLTVSDNSNGYFQALSQTVPTNLRHFGQAFQLKLSGSHIGGILLLQYVAVEGEPQPLTETQIFEG
jgi:hypothetical protein